MNRTLFAVWGGLTLLASAHAATVSGRVVDERRRPVEGARVDISAIPGGAAAFTPMQKSSLSARDGAFAFSLPAGTYRVCASLRHSRLLDPCLWSKTPPIITVAENQAVTMPPFSLLRGYPVTVKFNDAGGVLYRAKAAHSSSILTVGFTALNGMFHPVPPAIQGPIGREHVLVIPRDLPVTVSVMNHGFSIADANGHAVPSANRPYTFTALVAGERRPRSFTFNVSGLAQQVQP